MPILKPIFCAVALVDIHITKAFQVLLIDVDTNYSMLSIAFPKFYEELKTIHTIDLCSTTIQAFNFVSNNIFKSCIPDKAVCQSIEDCIQVYKDQIMPMMKLIISKISDGFDLQQGAILGFGTHANDETGSVLKVSNVSVEEMESQES